MRELNFLFVVIFLGSLFSGCTKDEAPPPESEDTALKAAVVKIPITRVLPNGKTIVFEIPASAVEGVLATAPKLPYSPEGVYVFQDKKTKEQYDVFITSFDGYYMRGTFGRPAGGPYELTGIVGNKGAVVGIIPFGFRLFRGVFAIDNGSTGVGEWQFATSEFDGIIKNWDVEEDIYEGNQFIVLRTEPYSSEGYYEIGEYEGSTPVLYIDLWITSFDGSYIEGKFASEKGIGGLEGRVEHEIKEGLRPFSMNLYLKYIDLWKTVEGYIDAEGTITFKSPFDWVGPTGPPVIIVG